MGENSPQTVPTSWPPVNRRPRVWPGIVIVLLYWAVLKVPARLEAEPMTQFMVGWFGSMVVPLLFYVWWIFFSRVTWRERIFGLLACAAVGIGAFALAHPSFQKTAMFAPLFYMLPAAMTGWIVWLLIARSMSPIPRLAGLVVVFVLTFGYFATVRFEGTTGAFDPRFSYRWTPTAEDTFLAESGGRKAQNQPEVAAATALEMRPEDWPGFRGPARDGSRPGIRVATDWNQHPPKQVWRHRVGPGWSSFAVVGERLFTQEQRGEDEVVVCYNAGTGNELWVHADATRFDESMSGAGPRATPTFHEGKLYALGANGTLNCLDAASGKKVWSRDVTKDSGRDAAEPKERLPIWGFSASPLVAQGIVMVYAGGPDGKGVLGYRADSGELAWTAGKGRDSYCSLQPARLGGIDQAVIANGAGMAAFDPATGKVLWEYQWDVGKEFNRVIQPAVISDTDLLLGTGMGFGTQRVHVARDGDKWQAEKVWESRALSPYFNDLVIHQGHMYGFHNQFFVCLDLESGKLKWKERGYANGQVLLLPDQDLLLILTESGDVALVEAKPEGRKELGRFKAFAGKTWNHPVVARGKLFIRNGEEAACYELPADGAAVAER